MLDQWPCWLLCWGNIETPWSHSGLKVNITAVSSHSILIFIQTTGCTGYVMSEITEALKGFPNLDNVKIKGMKQEEWTKDWWGDKEKVHGEEGERERWGDEVRWDEMRWDASIDYYQTGGEVNELEAMSVASLCLTLAGSLKVLVWSQKATSACLLSFVAVIMHCALLERLTLECMSAKHLPVLFFLFPSFPLPYLSFPCTNKV